MKCFICKKEIKESTRRLIRARNHREKDSFRDLCPICYDEQMREDGYFYEPSIRTWVKVMPL